MKDTCGRFKLFLTLTFYSKVTSVILSCNLNTTDNQFASYEHPLSINEKNMLDNVYLTLTFDANIIFL